MLFRKTLKILLIRVEVLYLEKKSQHYIPQTYLSEFIDTTVVKKNWTPTVHIFHWKNENEIVYLRQKPPKNICQESNYYSFNS